MLFSPGMILDNYKLLAKVGAGSCGSVWQAENIVSGELEALKILSDNELAERELRALKLYREIQHPALIHIRHVGCFGESIFYTMEWCESSLAERKVDAKELLTIAKQLASGLALLHSGGLLHRDIKPANIFFHQGTPVLGDIGLLTRKEGATFAGSPGFLSPGILSGKCSADCYSDCYALAKSIYCALAGFGPEQFPLYTGVMTPESSLLMRTVMAVCSPEPSIRTAEEFLNFLNHPLRESRKNSVLRRSVISLFCVIALGSAASLLWQKNAQKSPDAKEKRIITEKKKEPASLWKKAPCNQSRAEIEKAFTALPPAAEEKLRRLRLSKEVSDLLGCSGKIQFKPEQEALFLASLSPELRKMYQKITAEIGAMQATQKWQKINRAWTMRYFEYQSKLRKIELEQQSDAMSALQKLAEQEPLLGFHIKQSKCIITQKSLLAGKKQPDISALETFAAAAKEYGRAFRSLPPRVYQ